MKELFDDRGRTISRNGRFATENKKRSLPNWNSMTLESRRWKRAQLSEGAPQSVVRWSKYLRPVEPDSSLSTDSRHLPRYVTKLFSSRYVNSPPLMCRFSHFPCIHSGKEQVGSAGASTVVEAGAGGSSFSR